MKTSLTSLDEARAANPELRFCLYMMDPGGPVILEIHTPTDDYFTFLGPTEAAVLAAAFPDGVRDEDQQEPTSIFD